MNVQSDCESLYINCIEEYKKKYSIDDEKVYELFHEYNPGSVVAEGNISAIRDRQGF